MTALQKLRKHQGLLVASILLALLAFVLGDLVSTRQGGLGNLFSSNSVGTIEGNDLSWEQYNQTINNITEQNKGVPYAYASSQAWEAWVKEMVLNTQFDKAGIQIGSAGVMNGIVALPEIQQIPQFHNALGEVDANIIKQWAAMARQRMEEGNPEGTQMWSMWESLKESGSTQQKLQLYSMLLTAGFNATILDAKAQNIYQNAQMDGGAAYLPFTSVSDSEVAVTDAEIENYVGKHADKYKRSASRDIQYVYIPISPSVEDLAEVETRIVALKDDRTEYNPKTDSTELIVGFVNTKDDSTFVRLNSDTGFGFDNKFYHNFQNPEVQTWAFSANVGDVYGPYKTADAYNLSKLVEVRNIPDSVKVSHIFIGVNTQPNVNAPFIRTKEQAKSLADSLSGVIRSEKESFASLSLLYNDDQSTKIDGSIGWMSYTGAQELAHMEAFTFTGSKGDVKVIENPQGYQIVKIDDATAPKKAVKVATVTNVATPSNETVNKIFNQAQNLASLGNTTSIAFGQKATEQGLTTTPVEGITLLESYLSGVGDQPQLIRWSFEKARKIGDVKVFDVPGAYVVMLVSGMAEEGLAVADEVRSEIEPIIRDEKKGRILVDKFKAAANKTSAEALATEVGGQYIALVSLTMSSDVVPEAGRNPKVIGLALGMAEGTVSQPIIGETGVFLVQSTSKRGVASEEPSMLEMYRQSTDAYFKTMTGKFTQAVKKMYKIEDNREALLQKMIQ